MKKLLLFLMRFKWTLLFPFASFVIWFIGFLASSFERYLPVVLNKLVSYWGVPQGGYYNIVSFVANVGWFVNGVNAWFPIYVFVLYFFVILSWRLVFFGVRAFIKLITVGQV